MSPAAKGGSNATGGAGGGQKLLTEQQRQRALTRAERRRLRRSTPKYRNLHASRERIRVEAFNQAFQQVRQLLPPEAGGGGEQQQSSRKMSKIETLRAAIHYLRYLDFLLKQQQQQQQELAPTQQMNLCANGQNHHNCSSNAVVLR